MAAVKKAPSVGRVKDEKKKALDQGIKVTWNGVDYAVCLGDLSSLDTQALRREVGLSFLGIIKALNADPDIDLIAAIIWLRRRINGEVTLSYNEVAGQIDYNTDIDIAEHEADPDPEA